MISEHASPLADLGSVDSGGQNVYVAQMAINLARLGYEVDVFTRRDDSLMPDIVGWKEGIRVIHVPAGPAEFIRKEKLLEHMGAFTGYMIDFFNRQDQPYNLVHANFWMSGSVAADIKTALGIPFVITFHALGRVRRQYQGSNDEFPDQRFSIEQRIILEADGIISECPQDKEDLMHFYDVDPAKINQIPCGFDPQEFSPIDRAEARKKICIPEDEWLVLQVGRMVPRKGVDTAIRGFAGFVREQAVNARMLVVGGESRQPDPLQSPEIGRLQKISEEEGVQQRVLFTGRRGRNELKYYFSAADVFISTPWYETFGITPLESMACGTPVIGARVGGIKYTVVDNETGYLLPADDPQAVTARLIELYLSPKKLRRFGQQALKRVNKEFTWKKVAGLMAEVYENILANRKQPVPVDSLGQDSGELTIVWQGFDSALETLHRSQDLLDKSITEAAGLVIDCLERGGKVMVCGNGGSAADAQHFAAELVGRFMSQNRRGLSVLALTSDSVFLTAWSNDVGYEKIFTRQIEALGRPGDLLIGISTSGRSKNLIEAFRAAREMNIQCLSLLGGSGGDLLALSDAALVVPSWNAQRIQEVQILILHLLCELVEKHINNEQLFESEILVHALQGEGTPLEKRNGKSINYPD
jgi:phosphoheptose isomerase